MKYPLESHDPDVPEERQAAPAGRVQKFLSFMLARESYALPLASIHEIVKPPPITEVPRPPRDVLGVISVRGRVTTVIDLRRRLRLPEQDFAKSTRVLLVAAGDEILGLLVDGVHQVLRLTDAEIEVASTLGKDTADYVMGIGRPQHGARGSGRAREEAGRDGTRDDILILLDPNALLKR